MRSLPRLPESSRAAFLSAARSYVDVRWRHLGRNKRGIDCVGLIYAGLRDIGLDVDNIRAYAKTPDGVLLRETVVHHFGAPVSAWRPGDIALMRWHETREKVWHSHVGILGAHNDQWTLLHAYLQQGRVVEHRIDERWNGRITEVFSLTGAG